MARKGVVEKRRGEVVCCRRDDGAATVVAEVVWRNVEVGVRRRREASTAKRYAEEWGDRKGGKEAGVRRKWYAKVRGGGEKERGGEER